jgi:lambda repressor-like predicted transcriptional regulator
MSLDSMHREDVKAELRKRFPSIAAFERAKGLPSKSVNEVLRGRRWQRVADAIESALKQPLPENRTDSSRESAKTVAPAECRA